MNILFIGDLNTYARAYQRYKAMQDLGHEVTALATRPVPYRGGIDKPGLWWRVMNKLGYPPDRTGVNYRVLEAAKYQKPEIIWIEKGLTVRPTTLKHFEEIRPQATLVFYSEDDMYAKHNQSAYFRRCLPFYDIVFTTKSYNAEELPGIGAQRVVFVNKAYDQATHRPLPVTKEEKQQLGADVIFIGSFEQDRAQQMMHLAENDVPVRVWGACWEAWIGRHPNLTVEGRPVYESDYVKALCASKIALCFLRKANRDLQTDRTMEIPACGTFMLGERTQEHLRLFKEGKEAEFFDTKGELLEKVEYYLQHDEERERIARAGRRRCVKSGYSHHDRLEYMLGVINNDV